MGELTYRTWGESGPEIIVLHDVPAGSFTTADTAPGGDVGPETRFSQ